jgi:hypothetical protein
VGRLPALFHGVQSMQKPQRKSLEEGKSPPLLRPLPKNRATYSRRRCCADSGNSERPPPLARRNPNESRWSMNIIHRPTKVVGATH